MHHYEEGGHHYDGCEEGLGVNHYVDGAPHPRRRLKLRRVQPSDGAACAVSKCGGTGDFGAAWLRCHGCAVGSEALRLSSRGPKSSLTQAFRRPLRSPRWPV